MIYTIQLHPDLHPNPTDLHAIAALGIVTPKPPEAANNSQPIPELMRVLLGPLRCHANRDGGCKHATCPQIADGEPDKTGRHCPLDTLWEE